METFCVIRCLHMDLEQQINKHRKQGFEFVSHTVEVEAKEFGLSLQTVNWHVVIMKKVSAS